MGDVFFEVTNRAFFAFKLVIAPQREEIEPALLGMSLITLGGVPRSVFPLLENRSCENFGLAHFPILLLEKKN